MINSLIEVVLYTLAVYALTGCNVIDPSNNYLYHDKNLSCNCIFRLGFNIYSNCGVIAIC